MPNMQLFCQIAIVQSWSIPHLFNCIRVSYGFRIFIFCLELPCQSSVECVDSP